MADGMFTLRHLVEKRLGGQENVALGFIDLEKAVEECSTGGGEGGRRHI